MPQLGLPELIIILVIVLIIFGASRLRGIGQGLGGAISVTFFLVHLGVFWLVRGEFFPLWALAILSPVLITGILFIACWHLSLPEGNPT